MGYLLDADDTIDEQTEAWGHHRPDIDDIIAQDPYHNLGGLSDYSQYNQDILQGKIGEQDPDEMGHPIDPPMFGKEYDYAPDDRSTDNLGRRHSFGWSNVFPGMSGETQGNEQLPVYGEDDLNELRTGILDDLGNYHREALGDKQDHDNPEKQEFLKRLKNTPDMEGAQWLFGLVDDIILI